MKHQFALMLCLISISAFAQYEWELKKDKDGIKAYTKAVIGSNMKAIRATTEFHQSLETCVAVLRDIAHLKELFPDCLEAVKVLQTDTQQIHYLHLKAPWLVADRDATFKLEYAYDASTQAVTVTATTGAAEYPKKDGVVRMTQGGGTWTFTRLDNGHTSLLYYYHGDPGGNIPAWLANSVVEENPFKMLLNFHQLIKLERYQGKKFSFIR